MAICFRSRISSLSLRLPMGMPSMEMVPAWGRISPSMSRRMVVLPAPLRPRMVRFTPGAKNRSNSVRIVRPPTE